MKKILPAILALNLCLIFIGTAQTFTEIDVPFSDTFNSGGCVGVCDMNQDGYDDVVIFDQSKHLYIQYQNSDGSFTEQFYTSVSGSNQWGFSIGDYDQDGHNDVFSGGSYDGAHFIQISDIGIFESVEVDDDSFFMQGCSTADINNDGWLDVFGCHDDAESKIWGNDGSGGLVPENDWIDMVTIPSSDNSGNYGSVFCDVDNDGDIDLYIAKCRQGVTDITDPRRINALYINDGSGNYTEDADARGLAPLKQSWTSDFADIDNDGDFDCILTNHDYSLMLFENDGSGYFTDITEGSGLEDETGFFLQAKMEDFNNDGFVDIFYSGDIEAYFMNNGDQTFTEYSDKLPSNDVLHSFAFGDLNKDGYIDLYASYGNGYVNADMAHPDKLWLNDGGDNNWITFQLTGNESNINAIGAKIVITGDFGTQVREVRSGESYGIVNSFSLHFGLGDATEIETATIHWPSGEIQDIGSPEINAFQVYIEGCVSLPTATIASEGATVICNDESVTLDVSTDATNVLWSNGSTESSITVDETGDYYVEIWDDEECVSTSNHIFVEVYVPADPTIEVVGEEQLCEGDAVTLIASEGLEYTWNDGYDEGVYAITESGTYSVTVLDACENTMTSIDVTLDLSFFPVPDTPFIEDIEILSGQSATFVVSEENAFWYDSENSSVSIYNGSSFTTPILMETETYWVEYGNGGDPIEETGGKTNNGNGTYQNNSNYWNVFNAYEDMVLKQVKVYASGEGDRTISVVDEFGVEIISESIFIADGESVVTLNFSIPQGLNYSLRTSGDPQLWRDQSDEDFSYPYLIGDIASIEGTNITSDNWNNYYYFFYDWVVESNPFICAGERVEASAIVVGIEEFEFINDLQLYPVPAKDNLNISINSSKNAAIEFEMLNALGQTVVYEGNVNLVSGQNNFELTLEGLSSGMYFLNISIDGKILSKKVIVE